MKKMSLAALLALLLLLAACGGPAAESPSPAPSETPAPTEPVSPSEPASPAPTESVRPGLPWTLSSGESLSCDEYFAQQVTYTLEEVSNGFTSGGRDFVPVGVGFTGYGVTRNGDRLELWNSGMEDTFLWTVAEIPGAQPAAGTTRWLYAVVDGRELIRMDYYGENRTTVFTDDTGLLGELMFAEGNGGFFLLGEDLTYFLAGTEDGGVGVYRLYLPEDRTDLLYRYTPAQVEELTFSAYLSGERQEPRIQIGRPIPCFRQGLTTNQWVRWDAKDPEFYVKYAAMLADSGGNTGETEQYIEEKFNAAHATLYYADLGEDMLYTMPMSWLDMTGTTHVSPFRGCWFDLYLDQERTHRQSLGLANMV